MSKKQIVGQADEDFKEEDVSDYEEERQLRRAKNKKTEK